MILASALASCVGAGRPPPTWASAEKTGIGASYEAYVDGQFRDGGPTGRVSRVWFSIADGVLTETMYGLIHEAQIKRMRIAIMTPGGLVIEGGGQPSRTEYLDQDEQGRPTAPAYRVVTTDPAGAFEIEKHFFTDPDRDVVMVRVTVRAIDGEVVAFVILEPALANTGGQDEGRVSLQSLTASQGDVALALVPSQPFVAVTAGVTGGANDPLTDIGDGRIDRPSLSQPATNGGLTLVGQMAPVAAGAETTVDFALAFAANSLAAEAEAQKSLSAGYQAVLANYVGEGDEVGWRNYLASLPDLEQVAAMANDGGRLAFVSALMIKVQEDRTHAGALIASLSNPWGETTPAINSATGYKAVWPRDFYQVAMAFAALGDRETALAAYRYLPTVQVDAETPGNTGVGGWFLQKSEVDGTPEWVAVQLDQAAMPAMLGWRLWRRGWITDEEIVASYRMMLRSAAEFLVEGGVVGIDWNTEHIRPPRTQHERWEEQSGHSPSTTAAVIAGLIATADIARAAGELADAQRYEMAADAMVSGLRARMFTTSGQWGDGRYFLRINSDDDPNNDSPVESRNGKPAVSEDLMLDAGFLELVRYGVLRADDPDVLATLPELDDQTLPDDYRVRYDFTFPGVEGVFPGWRRYGMDGYGEDMATGLGYGATGEMAPGQRGRVWPFLTGERGHYELALAARDGIVTPAEIDAIRSVHLAAMEHFANQGLMLPEQVWDGVGHQGALRLGEGTNSATPLAWTHAEYLKLLRSLGDRAVWDRNQLVAARYADRERDSP